MGRILRRGGERSAAAEHQWSLPASCEYAAEPDQWGALFAAFTVLLLHGAATLVETLVFAVATLDVPIRFFIGELDERNVSRTPRKKRR